MTTKALSQNTSKKQELNDQQIDKRDLMMSIFSNAFFKGMSRTLALGSPNLALWAIQIIRVTLLDFSDRHICSWLANYHVENH